MFVKKYYLFSFFILFINCDNLPRKPINKKEKTFFKTSVVRNQNIITKESALLKEIVKKDTLNNYFSSEKGFWYTYITSNPNGKKAKIGQKVKFNYNIKTLEGKLLYSVEELGEKEYFFSKQDVLPAIREGIKIMREKEVVSFIFPSYLCFRYQGDGKKIGINQPLRITININSIL